MDHAGTSTSVDANGQPPVPANRLVPGTNREDTDNDFDFTSAHATYASAELPWDGTLAPDGKRSLSHIGLQAFCLGISFATALIVGPQLAYYEIALWRLFAFLGCLSLFHFLEYWTTARFNVGVVRASSFLLFTNGTAYNTAYTLAAVELLASALFFGDYGNWLTSWWTKGLGFVLVVIGQTTRSVAMAQAGTNFNHTPQKVRKDGHELVTTGIYGVLRHPSYFGFFWWAIGTQLLVGNKICVVGYCIVLWRFFSTRIFAEERTLIEFFGEDYKKFKARTPTGIPFIT